MEQSAASTVTKSTSGSIVKELKKAIFEFYARLGVARGNKSLIFSAALRYASQVEIFLAVQIISFNFGIILTPHGFFLASRT